MSATEPSVAQPRPVAPGQVSMRDLLASCAAARAVSTPPRLPDRAPAKERVEHRKAA
ncbi:hypothetical protein OG562_26215 [Streptomyces sp. NBC_01275]|uniref:hypothetical protein n=1 Tax=Streptomyces sp. NBC_01275 TaxID=2903807 RepID=UPI00224E9219|nr:hypothetical protein [Streptomyces sp. NBC_01275]MCX4764391.1 hypothetical protein [Streptomyces sp. NBC_01275]